MVGVVVCDVVAVLVAVVVGVVKQGNSSSWAATNITPNSEMVPPASHFKAYTASGELAIRLRIVWSALFPVSNEIMVLL